ncbi:hypothetical protein J3E61_006930 [Mycobacterium sp. OAE908]|uniref:hypothetical protein n=1 Tax=Mycobacterium sp. OAE908 TaxID=2817899 RepID=UPI0034E2C0A3
MTKLFFARKASMFEYFPGNYIWSYAAAGVLNCGGLIYEVDRACRPIRAAATKGADEGTTQLLAAWTALTDRLVEQAEDAERQGHFRTAGQLYARASTNLCNAERMQSAAEPTRLDSYREYFGCNRRHLSISTLEQLG